MVTASTALMDSILVVPGSQKQEQTPAGSASPSRGLVFVFNPQFQPKIHGSVAAYNLESYPEEIPIPPQRINFGAKRQNSKSCFSRLWLLGCSIPECKWQFYAIIAVCCAIACIVAAALYFQQKELETPPLLPPIEYPLTTSSTTSEFGLSTRKRSNAVAPKMYKNSIEEPTDSKRMPASESNEEQGDQPAPAPSTKDAKDCASVTYGDDTVPSCPRAHVRNLTITSNKGYSSLGGFLTQFPNLQNLTLDFETFCPQAPTHEYRKQANFLRSLNSLEELTIINSKSCENLSAALEFKLPRLEYLRFVNARMDMELNKHFLHMLEDACKPRPEGTFKFFEISHSDVCRDCGFEFDDCESEPGSGYNYTKYFV